MTPKHKQRIFKKRKKEKKKDPLLMCVTRYNEEMIQYTKRRLGQRFQGIEKPKTIKSSVSSR